MSDTNHSISLQIDLTDELSFEAGVLLAAAVLLYVLQKIAGRAPERKNNDERTEIPAIA